MNNTNEEIMDKLTKICVCKAVSRYSIKKAIKQGAKTFDDIQKITGAGSGSCSGKRCAYKIQELLDSYK